MAIEAITGTNAYQTMSTIQIQQPAVKAVESVATDGGALQDISTNVDATTAAVEGVHKSAEDGQQGGGSAGQEQSDAAKEKENEKIKKAVEDMNRKLNNAVAKYGIHEGTNRVTIKLVDKDTDKVIKELPPEQTLDMIAKVWEMAGILVDEKR